jgi:hypothetical protein
MHVVDKRHAAPPKPNAGAGPSGPDPRADAAASGAPGSPPSGDPDRREPAPSRPG